MTSGQVSRRYGRALFDLALEAGVVEQVASALAELADAVQSLDEGTLAPGVLTLQQRQQLVTSLIARAGGETLLSRFLGVLAANDRLEQLPAIRDSFTKLEDEAAGRVRVTVRSAKPLTDAELSALRSKFEKITGRKVLETALIDENLLGGVTVEAQGRVYDGSIRTQLALLERRMAG